MAIFNWIVLGFAIVLLIGSGVCWGLFIALDNSDWRSLGVKVFRISMVFVLLFVNVQIYGHIFGVLGGSEKPVVEVLEEES